MPLFGRPSTKGDAREAAYRRWFGRQDPFALVSLLLSAFSLTHFGTLFVDEAAGIVLGVVTLRRLARARREVAAGWDDNVPRPRTEGDWMAWAGIAVGAVSLACAVAVYVVLKPRR